MSRQNAQKVFVFPKDSLYNMSKLYMLVFAHNVSHKVKTWVFHGRSANVKAPAIECIWAVK